MAQPINIPILYTGLNAARPDWKGMGANIRESFRRIKEDAIAKKRYDDALKARERQEWMETIDVDRVNFANSQLQEMELATYNKYKNEVTTLTDQRQGKLSESDLMAGAQVANQYANNMQGLKNQETKRQLDLKVIEKDINKFDRKKAEKIMYWDYAKDGKYTGGELNNALRHIPESERVVENQKFTTNPDMMATYFGDRISPNLSGDDYREKIKDEYDTSIWTESGVDKDGRRTYKFNANEAVDIMYQKYSLPSEAQKLNSLLVDFDKLPDWEEKAIIDVWGRDKAPVAWETLKNADKLFARSRNTVEQVMSTSGTSDKSKITTIDVTSGDGDMSGEPVKKTGRVNGAMDIEGKPMDVVGGKDKILYTKIEYMTNPKTNKKEWMVYGQYDKPNPDLGEVAQGRRVITEEFLVPYEGEQEIIGRKYKVEGMEKYKEPKVTTLSGKIDATTLKKGQKYLVNDIEYTWNGQKLVK